MANPNKSTFMELPLGINFPNILEDTHCLRILKNIYGGEESGKTCFSHLKTRLTTILANYQSKFNEYLFYKGQSQIFDVQDQGNLHEYPGQQVAKWALSTCLNTPNQSIYESCRDTCKAEDGISLCASLILNPWMVTVVSGYPYTSVNAGVF